MKHRGHLFRRNSVDGNEESASARSLRSAKSLSLSVRQCGLNNTRGSVQPLSFPSCVRAHAKTAGPWRNPRESWARAPFRAGRPIGSFEADIFKHHLGRITRIGEFERRARIASGMHFADATWRFSAKCRVAETAFVSICPICPGMGDGP